MICDDLSYTHEGVPDRFKTIEYYGFTSSYQIQLYPYSFIFNSFYSSPTQAAITKDLSLTVAEDLSTLCLVLYPTWLLWLVQFPLSLMNAGRLCISLAKVIITQAIGLKKHMKRLNAPKHWMLDKLGGAFLDLEENKIVEFIKLDFGNVVMVTGGRNRGRVGVIRNRSKLKGSFETTTTYKTQQDMSLQQG
ncbi:hypothetical protein HID58_075730 [Brassica napus]|uniref:Small ribosomal subunit protein eS4 N-terminal domain-containing protein n=1 Tax=Brassica napus TaxID=3708 RepID=A0ABQ7YN49_BRANA|nr:hypothetical protein HID58_075730 [Brassica napus]